MIRVTSLHNAALRDALALVASSRERRKSGRCVLEGAHLCEVYLQRVGAPEIVVVTDDASQRPDVRALIAGLSSSRVLQVPTSIFAAHAATPADIGMLTVVPTPKGVIRADATFTILLDDLQDPGNVGSIIRSAAAAGVDQVLLSKACAFAWSPKVLRAAQGGHFLTSVVEDVALAGWAEEFGARGGQVAALVVADALPIDKADLTRTLALAIGNEGAGLAPALLAAATQRVTIPMARGTESVNAAAAAAVAMFETARQRRG